MAEFSKSGDATRFAMRRSLVFVILMLLWERAPPIW